VVIRILWMVRTVSVSPAWRLAEKVAKSWVTLEKSGGAAEFFEIHGNRGVPGPVHFDWKHDPVIPDAVGVDFPCCAESGVKTIRRLFAGNDPDLRDEPGVESAAPGFRGEAVGGHVGVSDLGERVDSSVGAAGAVNHHASSDEIGERTFESVLNGASVWLALPAIEGGSVVRELEAEPGVIWRRKIFLSRTFQGARKL